VRNGDRAQSAKPFDYGNRGVVDQRDAIPEDVSLRGAQKQCTLSDGKPWRRPNADKPWLVLTEPVVVRNLEPF
jgi:hypothetical protein